MEERISQRLVELRAGRDAYAIEAARQMMAFDAAIGELESLLNPDSGTEPEVREDVTAPEAEARSDG